MKKNLISVTRSLADDAIEFIYLNSAAIQCCPQLNSRQSVGLTGATVKQKGQWSALSVRKSLDVSAMGWGFG